MLRAGKKLKESVDFSRPLKKELENWDIGLIDPSWRLMLIGYEKISVAG